MTDKDVAYIWAFFTGEGDGGERISLAASKGNNALDWYTLNNGKPLFTSQFGEKGLRDPFIMRSHDGSKFYIIATDLKIDGRPDATAAHLSSFKGAQADGSQDVEIWGSPDLVHWSDQRHVRVSTEKAGNTWAPEAYWDEALGKYVMYWASNLYDSDNADEHYPLTYNRLMYATTDDFRTFSQPHVWVDVNRNGVPGSGSIDATVQQGDDGYYYRVYKDENTMTLRQERSRSLLTSMTAPDNSHLQSYASALAHQTDPEGHPVSGENAWHEVATKIGAGSQGYGGTFAGQGEGPSLFRANKDDVNGYQWYLFIDQPNYHHNQDGSAGPNHYVPFATNDLASGKWTGLAAQMPTHNFPTLKVGGKPRHGTVIPVTRSQYETVLRAFGSPAEIADALGK